MSIKSLFISAILAGAASAGNYDSNWDGWSSDSNQKNNGGYTATSADNSYTTTSPKGNSDNSWNSWNSQQSWGSATTVTVTATETVATNVAAQSTGGWDMWSPSPTCDCTSQESSSWGSKPGEMIIQVVDVGNANGSLTYWPEQVVAPVGSVVQFRFHPKNHTVTESSFAAPCQPLAANLTSPTHPGQRSGFVPITGMETTTTVYNVLINDTKPIWIYCGQTGHCQKGMAMVINQNMTDTVKTLENYKKAAAALPMPAAPSGAPSSAPSGYGGYSESAGWSQPAATGVAPTSTTSQVFVQPTQAASTTTSSGPLTFTGAATRPEAVNAGMAGLFVAGLAALL